MSVRGGKVLAVALLAAVSMQICSGSAIPIWEFLTRQEKISYLYSSFAQLVSGHCKATAVTLTVPVNQCKRNLLGYGYDQLQTFSDGQLDVLDPYQRGANELIWSSILRDHPSATLVTTRRPAPIPTPPASSIVILTQQNPNTAVPPVAPSTAPLPQQFPQNPLFETNPDQKNQFAMDMDVSYGYPTQSYAPQPPKTFLTGPLVFRVRPDGTPVEEDRYKPLPRDDDLEILQTTLRAPNGGGKHRRIATISSLKQQHLATLALQQDLQPPFEQQRNRRQFQVLSRPASLNGGYFYGKGQVS